MKMGFRWFGEGNDQVPLNYIKQIPGVEGMVWALHDMPPGEAWPLDKIMDVKKLADSHGFNMDVVESVNVHEDIKLGLASRDTYINNYKITIERLAQAGVKVICYNFMPIFDWIRTDLYKKHPDGSTAMFYEKAIVENMDPNDLVHKTLEDNNLTMPGWEPERLAKLEKLFQAYENMTEDDLWTNLKYFLEEIIPVAEQNDIRMAIHPDDPPWSIFGLPRIMTNKKSIKQLFELVDNYYNGITLCTGSLGANNENDIVDIIKDSIDRIHFAHIRNVKRFENGDFIETSHRMTDGSLNILEIVKAFHDSGYTGYVRPDHGRQIWDEEGRAGYGLYDRALGIMYLWGIWDAMTQLKEETMRS